MNNRLIMVIVGQNYIEPKYWRRWSFPDTQFFTSQWHQYGVYGSTVAGGDSGVPDPLLYVDRFFSLRIAENVLSEVAVVTGIVRKSWSKMCTCDRSCLVPLKFKTSHSVRTEVTFLISKPDALYCLVASSSICRCRDRHSLSISPL